jgi:hypothetical protein
MPPLRDATGRLRPPRNPREHRHLHHLLLEDRHSERARKRLFDVGTGKRDRLKSLPAAQERMHHAALYGARPHDRHFDHEIVENARPQPRQHAHLRARLNLEYANRVGAADDLVRGRIFGRYVLEFEWLAALLRDEV